MIGKILGAVAGAEASKYTRSLGGTGGAVLGALAVPVIRRMKILPLLVLGGGIYAAKKLADKAEAEKADATGADSTATTV